MKGSFIPYNKGLKQFSRDLRNESTLSEVLLWKELRAGQYRGYDFNRQKPLDNYIADFYCKKLDLVIEIDGISHSSAEAVEKDKKRDEAMKKYGLTVMRIKDIQVKRKMHAVLDEINNFIDDWEKENLP
ncbi:MAG: hypothetical protein JWO03_3723 [Bacteroidetes bacterium]|nr:hypothetical protein [Bacteroidota bacterium]